MMFRNDTLPHDSVAFSRTANQGSSAGMSCRDAARHQAATTVCRLISAPYCHFVKSHYPNENGSGKAVIEHGYGWPACQRHSDFILSALFLNSEIWAGGLVSGGVGCGQEVVGSFYCVMCHCQGCSCCFLLYLERMSASHNFGSHFTLNKAAHCLVLSFLPCCIIIFLLIIFSVILCSKVMESRTT